MAYADLGCIYTLQGLRLEALEAKYLAFQLSSEMPQQMRALGELAIELSEIGALEPARLAFRIVADSNAKVEVRANAVLELMDLESSVGNRVAFERYRAAAEEYGSRMSPRMSVDYFYKVAVGLGRFGQVARARSSFNSALELAERHGLNAWYFKIEQALEGLAKRNSEESHAPQVSAFVEAPVVRQVEVGLREYAATAVL
jgi:tetratricopeptide (TPR) repeat protein